MAVRYKRYILQGTYERPVTKEIERFLVHWVATSPLKAMEQARSGYYNTGYSNILFTEVYVEIPMMKALEKE